MDLREPRRCLKMNLFAFAVLVLGLSAPLYSQNGRPDVRNRIIRADRADIRENSDEDSVPAVEILYIGVGTRSIEINEAFIADDNWLRDLRIGIKNISPQTLTCVGISFGVLAEIDTKLKAQESWPWGLGFYRGDCDPGQKTGRKLRLAPGEQTVLDSSDVPRLYFSGDLFRKMSGLAKAVIHEDSWIRFKGKEPVELPIAFSKTVKFLKDDSY
jgi:hypothetical protein